jgi:hypothetical protein
VVAQILAYAAYLRGTSIEILEQQILRRQLRERGFETIAALAESEDQDGSFDADAFVGNLDDSLVAGRFRLVLVLDDAPAELVRLVGYLESIAPELVIDLVAMSAYEINGARALVPQRIEPEREEMQAAPSPSPNDGKKRAYAITPEEFELSIDGAPEKERAPLRQMLDWARGLEKEGVLRLSAVRGTSGATTLRPLLLNDEAGLITVWNSQRFSITFWRSVFERRAPGSIDRVEAVIAPAHVGSGNAIYEVSEQLFEALADAYREAARAIPRDSAERE